jgi:hypothetical protein
MSASTVTALSPCALNASAAQLLCALARRFGRPGACRFGGRAVKGLTWQIAADGAVRFRTERGEFPIWLDAEQAEQLGRD